MNFLFNIACAILYPVVRLWSNWRDKQQKIYVDYQAKAGERHAEALKKHGLA